MTDQKKALSQFDTSAWASEILFDAHFSDLGVSDLVWEPTCGVGNALAAIPAHIPCIGTEIDPVRANIAERNTGRPVLIGDCRTVLLPKSMVVTTIFGNPPWDYEVFQGLMERCSNMLKLGQRAGFILPAYFFQTSRTVQELSRKWSIAQEMIPRDIFPDLSKPTVFATFIRDNFPKLIGFSLYKEVSEMRELPARSQERFANRINGPRSVWREAVSEILTELGGTATLQIIYKTIEGKRPTGNTYWKEQIRKVLQKSFVRISEGLYAIPVINNPQN